ncbi:hypothetical protein VTI28DRAFT_9843 [Corynascus sepedonium]
MSEYDYSVRTSTTQTGNFTCLPETGQIQMPAYTTMVFLICCVCRWNNNPATHVQCINCGHVLSTACCTTEKHYVPANR